MRLAFGLRFACVDWKSAELLFDSTNHKCQVSTPSYKLNFTPPPLKVWTTATIETRQKTVISSKSHQRRMIRNTLCSEYCSQMIFLENWFFLLFWRSYTLSSVYSDTTQLLGIKKRCEDCHIRSFFGVCWDMYTCTFADSSIRRTACKHIHFSAQNISSGLSKLFFK